MKYAVVAKVLGEGEFISVTFDDDSLGALIPPAIKHQGIDYYRVDRRGLPVGFIQYSTEKPTTAYRSVLLETGFKLNSTEIQTRQLQPTAKILSASVSPIGPELTLYVLCDMECADLVERKFLVIHAGHYFDIPNPLTHIATLSYQGSQRHVFELQAVNDLYLSHKKKPMEGKA